MSLHAKLSASSAHRWMVCAGSVRESEGMPNKTSLAAATGTVAHEVGTHCLSEGAYPDAWQGRTLKEDGFTIKVDQEMVDALWVYLLYVDSVRAEEKGMMWVEVDLTPELKKLHPDLGGTADCVIYQPKARKLHVIDYKHGSGVFVGAAGNKQLRYYGMGALMSLPDVRPDTVVTTIVQPRCGSDDNLVRSDTFDAFDLIEFAGEVLTAVAETEKPDAPLVVETGACRFCPARLKCPELEKHSTALIEMDFDKQVATIMSPDKMASVLQILPALESRIKALRQEAYDMATRGTPPTGHKMVAKKGRRQWTDEEKAAAIVNRELAPALTRECYNPQVMKTLAQVEKAVGKKLFKDKLGELTAMVSSGYTLVADSDPRPPALEAGEGDFDTGA